VNGEKAKSLIAGRRLLFRDFSSPPCPTGATRTARQALCGAGGTTRTSRSRLPAGLARRTQLCLSGPGSLEAFRVPHDDGYRGHAFGNSNRIADRPFGEVQLKYISRPHIDRNHLLHRRHARSPLVNLP
jgi:hypothetical protein